MNYKHTCDTIFTHFQGITNNIYGFGRPFFAPSFVCPSTTCPPYFYPSIFVLTRPNDGWTGLYIKLCMQPTLNVYVFVQKTEHLSPTQNTLHVEAFICNHMLRVIAQSRERLTEEDLNHYS